MGRVLHPPVEMGAIEHQAGGDRGPPPRAIADRPGTTRPERGWLRPSRGGAPNRARRWPAGTEGQPAEGGSPRPDSSAAAVDPGRRNRCRSRPAPGDQAPPDCCGRPPGGDQPQTPAAGSRGSSAPGSRAAGEVHHGVGLALAVGRGVGIKHRHWPGFPRASSSTGASKNPRSWPSAVADPAGQPPAGRQQCRHHRTNTSATLIRAFQKAGRRAAKGAAA